MSRRKRFVVGLPEGVRVPVVDKNPGYYPVMDMEGPFVFGALVCLCDTEQQAGRIAFLLNQDNEDRC